MYSDNHHVVLPNEAECFIESLKPFKLKDFGKLKWLTQHEMIEKLNIQALLSVSTQNDEFIKDMLITIGKIPVLIHELIAVDVWKQKILPEIFKLDFQPRSTVPIYLVLHHEAALVNLLETICYHQDSCTSADDYLLDLVDYCYKKIIYLLINKDSLGAEREFISASELTQVSSEEELQQLSQILDFEISIKAISILRYIIDFMSDLPVSVSSRVLNTHDIPMLLVALVEESPWMKYNKDGHMMKFVENKWQLMEGEDKLKLTKTEGQVWIALLKIFLSSDCLLKYDVNDHRKNKLLKLRPYLNDVKLDQIPNLVELMKYLGHLALIDPPPAKKDLIFEQVPQLFEKFLKENEGQWKRIALKQANTVFNPKNIEDQAKRWMEIYNFDMLDDLLPDSPKCAFCGSSASKRCSQCQNEWYCRRECQVQHWGKHKIACQLMVHEQKTDKENAS